ncbi:MAG: nuclear transport factor 2 family protein [Pseudomonadales bacterium]
MTGERGKNTELAVKTYLKTLGQGKQKILELYAQDAILLTPKGPFQGQDAIAEFYEEFIRDTLPLLASSYSLQRFDVVGEAAYLNWSAEPSIPTGSDTFLIHEGLIVLHTTHAYMPQ